MCGTDGPGEHSRSVESLATHSRGPFDGWDLSDPRDVAPGRSIYVLSASLGDPTDSHAETVARPSDRLTRGRGPHSTPRKPGAARSLWGRREPPPPLNTCQTQREPPRSHDPQRGRRSGVPLRLRAPLRTSHQEDPSRQEPLTQRPLMPMRGTSPRRRTTLRNVADDVRLTQAEAYEAAYRFVWQYMDREPDPDGARLQEMLVALEPTGDRYRTNDPASWADWLKCVRDTLDGVPLPRFPRT